MKRYVVLAILALAVGAFGALGFNLWRSQRHAEALAVSLADAQRAVRDRDAQIENLKDAATAADQSNQKAIERKVIVEKEIQYVQAQPDDGRCGSPVRAALGVLRDKTEASAEPR